MKYKHAEKGIMLILVSEIFYLIGSLPEITGSLFWSISTSVQDGINVRIDTSVGLISILFGLAALVIMIVTAVFGIIGYINAARDEKGFRNAAICALASGVLYVAEASAQPVSSTLNTMISASGTIVEMFVMVFAMMGLYNLAENCGRQDLTSRGIMLLRAVIIAYVVSSLNAIIIRVFELSSSAKIVALITGGLDYILGVACHILYIIYLLKTRKIWL